MEIITNLHYLIFPFLCLYTVNIHLYCYFNQRENRIILERKFLELKILTAILFYIAVVQPLSRVQLFSTLWTAAHQTSLSFTITQSLLKLMSIESVMPSNHLSSSVTPFSSCPQPFPASGSFPVSWHFRQVAKVLELQLQHQSFQ